MLVSFCLFYVGSLFENTTFLESRQTSTIREGQTNVHLVKMKRDERIRFHVEQITAQVHIAMKTESGEILWQNSPYSGLSTPIFFVVQAPEEGPYEVHVSATDFFERDTRRANSEHSGDYSITILERFDSETWQRHLQEQQSDARVRWAAERLPELSPISPYHEDFSDLTLLKEKIGDKRIVLLGEQSHNESEPYLWKTRLIKFLHQEMGFEVLAFEYGLYNLFRLQQKAAASELDLKDWQLGLPTAILGVEEFMPLKSYLESGARSDCPLILAGVDHLGKGVIAREFTEKVLARTGFRTDDLMPSFLTVMEDIAWGRYINGRKELPKKFEIEAFLASLDLLIKHFEAKAELNDQENKVLLQCLIATKAFSKREFHTPASFSEHFYEAERARDQQMGDNLLWLARELYPDKKIIVWAASTHIARKLDLLRHVDKKKAGVRTQTLGNVAWEQMHDHIYALAFVAFEGHYGSPVFYRNNQYPHIQEDQYKGLELEEIMYLAGKEQTFIDLRNPGPGGEWLKSVFPARPLGNETWLAPWSELFDAFIFYRESTPMDIASIYLD